MRVVSRFSGMTSLTWMCELSLSCAASFKDCFFAMQQACQKSGVNVRALHYRKTGEWQPVDGTEYHAINANLTGDAFLQEAVSHPLNAPRDSRETGFSHISFAELCQLQSHCHWYLWQ